MKQQWLKTAKLILLIVLSGAVGFFLMTGMLAILPDQITHLKGGGAEGVLAIFVLLFLSYFTVVSLHELGHLLAGLAQGFKFYMYVVGFLGVRRDENDRVEFYLNKDMQLFGGIAGSFPVKEEANVLRKMAWVVAAGPLTTLFTGIIFTVAAFAMLYQLTADATAFEKLLSGFLLFSAFMSAAIFLATTLPNRTGPFFTDRARFFRLIRGGKAAEVEQAVFELITLSYIGKRYRDLDKAKIELLKTDPSKMMQSVSDFYHYYYHLDRQEYEQALAYARQLEQDSAEMPASLKNEYLREAAFSYAFIAKDTEKARQAWQVVQKLYDKLETVSVSRTKTALLLAQNQPDQARILLNKALSKLGDKPQKGTDLLEKDLLEQLQQQLQANQTLV